MSSKTLEPSFPLEVRGGGGGVCPRFARLYKSRRAATVRNEETPRGFRAPPPAGAERPERAAAKTALLFFTVSARRAWRRGESALTVASGEARSKGKGAAGACLALADRRSAEQRERALAGDTAAGIAERASPRHEAAPLRKIPQGILADCGIKAPAL